MAAVALGVRINCLLASPDIGVQQIASRVFEGVDLAVQDETGEAVELISKSHFDGFIIDCDGMEGGQSVVARIRSSRANRNSVIFAIVGGKTSMGRATELGANFVLGTPLDRCSLSTYFQSSLDKMQTEHRRYFRYQLMLGADVVRGDGNIAAAQILNLGNGGMALRLLEQRQLRGPLTIRFSIPNDQKTVITALAFVCWSRSPIFGVKFVHMDDVSQFAYTEWLAAMDLP